MTDNTIDSNKSQKYIVPIGPQHPALKEPGHFEFTVDGEIVVDASIRLGYVHRGVEKAAENRTWTQVLYLVERVCGICSHAHGTAFIQNAEALAGIEIPPRAKVIRAIAGEIERLHSHLLWLGVAAHEGGFDAMFMYSWRDREIVMDILENFFGNRVNYSVNIPGGVKEDITPEFADQLRKKLDFLEKRLKHYLDVVNTDATFRARTVNIGTLGKEEMSRLGATGPTARSAGITRDIRVDRPYSGFDIYPINMILDDHGDLNARFVVRLKECFESIRYIRDVLDKIPEGELAVKFPRKIPTGESMSSVEAPRGELFYFVRSNGTESPDRVKVRTASLCNWGTIVSAVAKGHKLADMPMILAGIDPCFSCNDRMVNIVGKGKDAQLWTWEQLRKYSIEYHAMQEGFNVTDCGIEQLREEK